MQYFNSSQDFFYTTASSSLTYVLTCDGEFVYTGRCVKSPSAAEMKINVAERVRDWTAQNMPDFRQFDGEVVQHPYAYRVFELRDDLGTLLETYGVLLDWGVPFTGADLIMSDPVNGHVDARQKIFWSSFGLNARQIPIEFAADLHIVFNPAPPFALDGSGGTLNISYTANTDFTFSYNGGGWFTATAGGGTITITAQENEGEGRSGSVCFTYLGSDFQNHTVCYRVVQGSYVNPCVESAITYETEIGYTQSPYLGPWAYCQILKYVNCPELIATSGGTFYDCRNLEVALVPKLEDAGGHIELTYLAGMFNGCRSLTSIQLPSIKYLGYATFQGCDKLSSVTLGADLITIGQNAFGSNWTDSHFTFLTINYQGTKAQFDNVATANGWITYSTSKFEIICSDGPATHIWNNGLVLLPSFSAVTADTWIHADGVVYDNWFDYPNIRDLTISGATGVNWTFGDDRSNISSAVSMDNLTIYTDGEASLKMRGEYNTTRISSIDIHASRVTIYGLSYLQLSALTLHSELTNLVIYGSRPSVYNTPTFTGNPNLTVITFDGTKAQWNNINKEFWQYWNYDSNITAIRCNDGDIPI